MRRTEGSLKHVRSSIGEYVDSSFSMPIYRHPADKSPPLLPWSPTVDHIRNAVSSYLQQPLNHALIQYYRHGGDYISEHSDKTIDVVKNSYIVNVSMGAERVMVLRMKKDGLEQEQLQEEQEERAGCR